MADEANMRRVTAIRNGTVIDHVPSGQALTVLKMLGVDGRMSNPVSLVMNVPSQKIGSKDIIKVEDRELTQAELNRLALVSPDASVAIIRSYSVAQKLVVNLGNEVTDVVSCSFGNCITVNSREPLPHRIRVLSRDPLELRCHYCGRRQEIESLVDNLL